MVLCVDEESQIQMLDRTRSRVYEPRQIIERYDAVLRQPSSRSHCASSLEVSVADRATLNAIAAHLRHSPPFVSRQETGRAAEENRRRRGPGDLLSLRP